MKAGHRLTVDRIEGDLAVVQVEGGPLLDIPLWFLPHGCQEGDLLVATPAHGDGYSRVEIRLNAEATRAARADTADRLDRLRSRDPGGDLVL
jgi:hypothetical protein